jgi:branched-chain amino acid transport system permease protein
MLSSLRARLLTIWQRSARRPWPASDVAPLVIFLVFALVPVFAGLGAEIYLLSLFTRVMIFAIAALALDLIVGYGALVSFGHAAFVGLGAYAVGILASHGFHEALLSLPLAVVVAALFAAATGLVCLRTKGVYFIMITLAFGQMAFFTASSLAPYGGDDGLTIRTRDTVLGFAVFHHDRALYYVAFGCLLAAFLLCRAIVGSRFGRVLRGARENPTRMAAIGFEVFRYQLIAYVISGALAGLSGFLLANATAFVSPAYMSWQRSGELIIMVVFGGLGTLYGAIIGTAAFLLTEEWLSGLTEHWKVIFGPLLVLVVVFARGGLVGLVSQTAQAFGDDPIGHGSDIAVKILADLRRYASQAVQELRNAQIVLAAQWGPTIQTMAAHSRRRVRRAKKATRRIAAQAVQELRNAQIALAAQWGPTIQAIAAHSTQRLRSAKEAIRPKAAQLAPKLQAIHGLTGHLLRRLRDEIVELSTHLTRRFRGG